MLSEPLETPRLAIRRFEAGDLAAFFSYASDAGVMAFVEEGCLNEPEARAFVDKNMGEETEAYALALKGERRLIGHLIFHLWFAPRTYEIGWVVHPAYQRQGYASEAAHAMLGYAFAALDAHRVIATCQPENPASYRVMEKIGMRREGHFRRCIHRGDDLWWDEYFYALLAEEWFGANVAP